MRPRTFGLLAALFAAMLAPGAALAAKPKVAEVPAAARKQGMAEAPAVAQALGLSCQISDARFVGKSADPKTRAEHTYYEVACGAGPGLVLQTTKGEPPSAFSCIETAVSLPCILPGNLDLNAGMIPLLAQAKTTCTPIKVRGIGQTKDKTLLEVACQEGSGYIVVASVPLDAAKPVDAQNCLAYDEADSAVKCTLTDRASRLAVVERYVTEAKNGCVVKDRRYIGAAKDGSDFFESSCEDGKGYIYKINAGHVTESVDCAKAQSYLGGCTLTDSRKAATEQAALYTRLAKEAGSSCDVETYAVFPATGAKDVVELACKDGKGAVGIFEAAGKGQVVDCGHAPLIGYRCSLSKDKGYDLLTADLRMMDKKQCVVSNAGPAGRTASGSGVLEVACSDGLPGWVIEYNSTTLKPVNVTGCKFTVCKLPGNG
jgi:hypothetical protein